MLFCINYLNVMDGDRDGFIYYEDDDVMFAKD